MIVGQHHNRDVLVAAFVETGSLEEDCLCRERVAVVEDEGGDAGQ